MWHGALNLFTRARVELAAELVAIGVARSNHVAEGEAGLLKKILSPLKRVLRTTSDGEEEISSEEEWQGRALDQERRTQNIVNENGMMLKLELARVENKIEERIEERIEKLNKDIEERIEKSNKELMEAIQQLMIKR